MLRDAELKKKQYNSIKWKGSEQGWVGIINKMSMKKCIIGMYYAVKYTHIICLVLYVWYVFFFFNQISVIK